MSDEKQKQEFGQYMPDESAFKQRLAARHRRGCVAQVFFYFSIAVAIVALITLFANVVDEAFGTIATINEIDPETLTEDGAPLDSLTEAELVDILVEYAPGRLPVLIRDNLSQVEPDQYLDMPLPQMLPDGAIIPEDMSDETIRSIRQTYENDESSQIMANLLSDNLSAQIMERLVLEEVVKLQVVGSWSLTTTLFNYEMSEDIKNRIDAIPEDISELESQIADLNSQIDDAETSDEIKQFRNEISTLEDEISTLEDELAQLSKSSIESEVYTGEYPGAEIKRFHAWLTSDFISTPMSSVPANAGIRTALLGSMFMMVIVVLVALPIGVGAALYLEEYATDNFLNRVIETNVRNLAGVPSIIYGMLGLAIFVRVFAPFTGGQIFGANLPDQSNARVILLLERAIGYDMLPDDIWVTLEEDLITAALEREVNALSSGELQRMLNALPEDKLQDLYNRLPDYDFPDPDPEAVSTIDDQALTTEELERLTETFRSYRVPTLASLFSFGSPSANQLAAELAEDLNWQIEESEDNFRDMYVSTRFSNEEMQALLDSLRDYASFTVNGRTILSAALTLALLILPIIIINAQEALRAVPYTIREASYGLGATRWQTIWRQVLPAAIPGILTGTILSVSRAVGETAPLIVVGASTFILIDPNGPFAQFTALPIQIFQWTARPQDQFRDIAAAAIIVLLVLMLTLNAIAIVLRNRYTIKF